MEGAHHVGEVEGAGVVGEDGEMRRQEGPSPSRSAAEDVHRSRGCVHEREREFVNSVGCSCVSRDENGTDIFRPYSRPNSFREVLIRSYPSPDI
jgi:hypothetical protein